MQVLMRLIQMMTSCAVPVAIYAVQQESHPLIWNTKSLILCIFITTVVLHFLAYINSIARRQDWTQRIWASIKYLVFQYHSRGNELDSHGPS